MKERDQIHDRKGKWKRGMLCFLFFCIVMVHDVCVYCFGFFFFFFNFYFFISAFIHIFFFFFFFSSFIWSIPFVFNSGSIFLMLFCSSIWNDDGWI